MAVVSAAGSTAPALLVAIPAAHAMAFLPGRRTRIVPLWMPSRTVPTAVGVPVPIC